MPESNLRDGVVNCLTPVCVRAVDDNGRDAVLLEDVQIHPDVPIELVKAGKRCCVVFNRGEWFIIQIEV